jgi:hypothetical protein
MKMHVLSRRMPPCRRETAVRPACPKFGIRVALAVGRDGRTTAIKETKMGQARICHKATLFAGSILVMLVTYEGTSHAVSNTYNGSQCHGVQHSEESTMTRSSGTITTSSSGTAVVCPIIKTTSGPGITGDEISSVTVAASAGNTTCYLGVYNANKYQLWDDTNLQEEDSATLSSSNSWSITLTSIQDGYWEGYEDHDTWYYAELYCTFNNAGSNIVSYTVNESGTAQTKYRIAGAANCAQSPESASSYYYYRGTSVSAGGFVGAVSDGTDESHYNIVCPPIGSSLSNAEIAVGPSTNSSHNMECKIGAFSFSTFAAGTHNMPPLTKTLSYFGPDSLTCNMVFGSGNVLGDARVLSYRFASCTNAFSDTSCP